MVTGLRNPYGIAFNPEGEAFTYDADNEGDIGLPLYRPARVNHLVSGANFGWPMISYGTDYTGAPVGEGETQQAGMVQPRYFWRPSIAPSGLIFYTGEMFPEWQGNIFVTALTGQHIARLVMDGDRVVAEERLLLDRKQRIRELRQGPDGALYVLTNEESDAPKGFAQLLRISK